jgi:hypothetical protein
VRWNLHLMALLAVPLLLSCLLWWHVTYRVDTILGDIALPLK